MDSGRVETDEGEPLSFADFAVLYRTEEQADALIEALGRSGMPLQKRSHARLADLPPVKALVGQMETMSGDAPTGDAVLQRLNRAIGTLQRDRSVKKPASAGQTPETGPSLLAAAGTPDPSATLLQLDHFLPALRALAGKHGNDLNGFLAELALGVEVDLWDPRADRVSLLTLHASKGLEFPVVFIVGCEDGLLPLRWSHAERASLSWQDDPAEERRLFFVGMTRAEQHLLLSHTLRRRRRGRVMVMNPSPFLQDIQQQLLNLYRHRPSRRPSSKHTQRKFFD